MRKKKERMYVCLVVAHCAVPSHRVDGPLARLHLYCWVAVFSPLLAIPMSLQRRIRFANFVPGSPWAHTARPFPLAMRLSLLPLPPVSLHPSHVRPLLVHLPLPVETRGDPVIAVATDGKSEHESEERDDQDPLEVHDSS